MDNETVYLPGKIRDRIQDLMKSRKVTQAKLAAKIGCSESALSRFISLGHLPGDIFIKGEHGSFYFPIVSCIVLSVVMSILLNLFHR